MTRIRLLASKLWRVLTTIPDRLSSGRYFSVASALSFSSILALVPLLTVVFSALSLFPVFESWSGEIQNFIYANFVPQLGQQIQIYLQDFSAKAGQLTFWGLIFLVITTLTLLATIEDAFNQIWRVEKGRRFSQRILVYWALLTLGPVLIAASLSVSSYLFSLTIVEGQALSSNLKSQVLSILPFIFELTAFVFLYVSAPNCEVKLKHALIGGIVAAILFEAAKFGFTQYLVYFTSYQRIYGAVAILPVFLIWVYLSWLVILIGAYVSAAFGDPQRN